MGLRKQEAELMIRCPECGRQSDEYNWTLKTAAHYSIRRNLSTVIQVILYPGGAGRFCGLPYDLSPLQLRHRFYTY